MTETDPVPETLCLEKFRTMDNVQNNYHIYDSTPSSKTLRLGKKVAVIEISQ
jgi:hypothetical protein